MRATERIKKNREKEKEKKREREREKEDEYQCQGEKNTGRLARALINTYMYT